MTGITNTPQSGCILLRVVVSLVLQLSFILHLVAHSNKKTRYLLIHDMRENSRDKWIMVANRLQTTYGGGLAESELNSHCG